MAFDDSITLKTLILDATREYQNEKINVSGIRVIKLGYRPAGVEIWISTDNTGDNLYKLENKGDGWINIPEPLYNCYITTKGTNDDDKITLYYSGELSDNFAVGNAVTERIGEVEKVESINSVKMLEDISDNVVNKINSNNLLSFLKKKNNNLLIENIDLETIDTSLLRFQFNKNSNEVGDSYSINMKKNNIMIYEDMKSESAITKNIFFSLLYSSYFNKNQFLYFNIDYFYSIYNYNTNYTLKKILANDFFLAGNLGNFNNNALIMAKSKKDTNNLIIEDKQIVTKTNNLEILITANSSDINQRQVLLELLLNQELIKNNNMQLYIGAIINFSIIMDIKLITDETISIK